MLTHARWCPKVEKMAPSHDSRTLAMTYNLIDEDRHLGREPIIGDSPFKFSDSKIVYNAKFTEKDHLKTI